MAKIKKWEEYSIDFREHMQRQLGVTSEGVFPTGMKESEKALRRFNCYSHNGQPVELKEGQVRSKKEFFSPKTRRTRSNKAHLLLPGV